MQFLSCCEIVCICLPYGPRHIVNLFICRVVPDFCMSYCFCCHFLILAFSDLIPFQIRLDLLHYRSVSYFDLMLWNKILFIRYIQILLVFFFIILISVNYIWKKISNKKPRTRRGQNLTVWSWSEWFLSGLLKARRRKALHLQTPASFSVYDTAFWDIPDPAPTGSKRQWNRDRSGSPDRNWQQHP